jgi:hypothetical protein
MQIIRTKQLGAPMAFHVIGLAPVHAPSGQVTRLPSPLCDRLKVEAGNKVHLTRYATGTQIYRWTESAFFVEPAATLYANANYNEK